MRSAVAIARGSATLLCLTATLLVAACGSPTPRDFPALTLTNSPETTGEPGGQWELRPAQPTRPQGEPVTL